MTNLPLNVSFELPKEYKDYNFVNCSFDCDGNPNILLVKGDHEQLDEDDFPVLLSKNKLDYTLIIVSDKIEVFQLKEIFEYYDFAMKVEENKYLFACSQFHDKEGLNFGNNCRIYNKEKTILSEFCVGSYFKDIQISRNGKIWVAEGDMAIFGNWEPAQSGLCCFDLEGNVLYGFASNKISIYDCYAINISDEDVWFYYYIDFKFAQMIDNKVKQTIKSPISFVKFFSLSSDRKKILMDNGYKNEKTFSLFLMDKKFKKQGDIQFLSEEGTLLSCCRAQGNKMCFWENNKLYLATIDYVITENLYSRDKVFHEILRYQGNIGINLDIIQYLIDLGVNVSGRL